MTDPAFRIEPLGEEHDRGTFRCGEESLDQYLRTQASQDIRRRISNCFVVVESPSPKMVCAYYTLSAASILLGDLPSEVTKRLPRYPTVPAIRIGRLAVDRRFQKRGLGAALLIDAARKSLRGDAAAFALVVDSKNEAATAFYRHYGFFPLSSQSRMLFLPIASAEKALLQKPL
jgi:ribosomal protein S18 acetylase RimI-like enzyme